MRASRVRKSIFAPEFFLRSFFEDTIVFTDLFLRPLFDEPEPMMLPTRQVVERERIPWRSGRESVYNAEIIPILISKDNVLRIGVDRSRGQSLIVSGIHMPDEPFIAYHIGLNGVDSEELREFVSHTLQINVTRFKKYWPYSLEKTPAVMHAMDYLNNYASELAGALVLPKGKIISDVRIVQEEDEDDLLEADGLGFEFISGMLGRVEIGRCVYPNLEGRINIIPNACMYSLMLNYFHVSRVVWPQHVPTDQLYQHLKEKLGLKERQNWATRVTEWVPIFHELKIDVIVRNVYNKVIWTYKGKQEHTNSNTHAHYRETLNLYTYQGHAIAVDDNSCLNNTDPLTYFRNMENKETELQPVKWKQTNANTILLQVDTMEQLGETLNSIYDPNSVEWKEKYKKSDSFIIEATGDEIDMLKLYEDFISIKKQVYSLKIKKGHIEGLSFPSFNISKDKKISISINRSCPTMFLGKDLFEYTTKKEFMSKYSTSFIETYNKHFPEAPIGTLPHTKDRADEPFQIDQCKCYTYWFMQIQKIPVFTEFDQLFKYEGQPIENLYLYLAEIHHPMLARERTLTYGFNLRKTDTILGYIPYSYTIPFDAYKEIKSVYNKFDNQVDKDGSLITKKIVNLVIGMTGKKHVTYTKGFMCKTLGEVRHMYDQNNQLGHYQLIKDGERTLYYYYTETKMKLMSGFLPINIMIKDMARRSLMDLFDEISKFNVQCYAFNTDCIYIKPNEANVKEHIKSFLIKKNMLEDDSASIFDNIGKFHFKNAGQQFTKIDSTFNVIKMKYEDEDIKLFPTMTKVNEHQEGKSTFVEGLVPGSGKTTLCATSILPNARKLFVINNWELANAITEKYKVDAVTPHKLLGLRGIDEDINQTKSAIKPDDYDCFVFEEWYFNPAHIMNKLRKFKLAHPDKIFIGNGDSVQLASPDDRVTIKAKQRYTHLMFDNVISLEKSYRDPENLDKYTKMKKILFENKESTLREKKQKLIDELSIQTKEVGEKFSIFKRGLCYYNDGGPQTKQLLNKFILNEVQKGSYKPGDTVVSLKTIKGQITAKRSYRVISDNITSVTIQSEIGINSYEKRYFEPTFTTTVHSAQGITIEEDKSKNESGKYTIYDYFDDRADESWVYVALTRGKLDKVTIWKETAKMPYAYELKRI